MKTRILAIVYLALAWVLGGIGFLHMGTTFRLHAASPFTRVWFFGTGIAIVQGAALNLLHRSYGRTAVGIRWTTRAFNVLMLIFGAAAGASTGASALELVIILGVLCVVLMLSFTSAAYKA